MSEHVEEVGWPGEELWLKCQSAKRLEIGQSYAKQAASQAHLKSEGVAYWNESGPEYSNSFLCAMMVMVLGVFCGVAAASFVPACAPGLGY